METKIPRTTTTLSLPKVSVRGLLPWCMAGLTAITCLVYLTGGPHSPVLFLYLPLVMLPSVLATRAIALGVAFASAGVYALLGWAMIGGVISSAGGANSVDSPPGGLALQVIGLLSGMVLVSVLANFLVRRLSRGIKVIEESHRHLTALTDLQASVINEFPEGIISTAIDGTIVSINQAASEILRISDRDVHGVVLSKVLENVGNSGELRNLIEEELTVPREIEIQHAGDDHQHILISTRPTISSEGERTGMVFILQDVTRLRSVEDQLALQERMAQLLATREDGGKAHTRLDQFVGESVVMQKVFKLIERVSPSDATVLINGESGTGKELVARSLHLGSSRARGPFVPVNCGAIPETLIESELFGHKRGAFTGAENDYIGLFRQAEGGTIFLDEIGEIPLHMQAKLLRAIQERMVRPVGSNRDIPINVRIVTATNRNLRAEIEQGNFREDLFYRLNVISIALPPLRDRKEDIPFLANSILKRLVDRDRTPVVPPATMQLLLGYGYPGNVRELENVLERAVVLGGEVILPEHLPETMRSPAAARPVVGVTETRIIIDETIEFPVDLDRVLATIERRYLESALSKTKGAKKKAAELLGMNFRSFRYRLQKFGLHEEEGEINK